MSSATVRVSRSWTYTGWLLGWLVYVVVEVGCGWDFGDTSAHLALASRYMHANLNDSMRRLAVGGMDVHPVSPPTYLPTTFFLAAGDVAVRSRDVALVIWSGVRMPRSAPATSE